MMDLPKFGTTSRGWSSKHPKTRTFAVAAGDGHGMRPAWRVCRHGLQQQGPAGDRFAMMIGISQPHE